MPRLKFRKLGLKGDTIVEVMIAMVLVGSALVASYGIARRSLSQIRDAQERSEMLKIGESQLEALKNYVANEAGYNNIQKLNIVYPVFCLRNSGTTLEPANPPADYIESVKDIRCAINQKGGFYMDEVGDTTKSSEEVDNMGYFYRAAVVYHHYDNGIGGPAAKELNDFYVFAGRITGSSASVNAPGNSVVTLFYRQHP